MQISRQLLMACAVATFLTPTLVHAYDNEAQIRARQALEAQMKQTEAQTPPATSAPPAVVVKPQSKPAVTAAPAAAVPPDRIHQALEEKMKEMQAQTPAVPPTPPAKTKPAFGPSPSLFVDDPDAPLKLCKFVKPVPSVFTANTVPLPQVPPR